MLYSSIFGILLSYIFLLLGHTEGLEFCPGLFKVVVDNDFVENTGGLCKLELVLSLSQTLGDGVLRIGGTAAQTRLEDLERWWLQGEVAGVEVLLLYLLDTL